MNNKTYDILKVAHHGSKYSTTEAFLKLVKPRIAWISAGENNSYGHPHAETIRRLKIAENLPVENPGHSLAMPVTKDHTLSLP